MNNGDTQPAFRLAADPGFTPPPDRAPAHRMLESTYRPHEKEREYYREIFRHFPEERRARVHQCGVYALHMVTHTSTGSLQHINPISCGDRAACIACGLRYAASQANEHVRLLKAIVGQLDARFTAVRATLRLPRWAAAGAHTGCEAAETRGKLCRPTTCRTCTAAWESQETAAAIETHVRHAVLGAAKRAACGIGGMYHATPVQTEAGPALMVTILIPQVAALAQQAQRLAPIDVGGVKAAFERETRDCGGTVTKWEAEGDLDVNTMLAVIGAAHKPFIAQLHTYAANMTETDVRTISRLYSVGAASESGRVRRLTRTQWFGAFSARRKAATLATLGVQIHAQTTKAVRQIIDKYLILHRSDEFYTVQSTRDAATHVYHASMVQRSAYVLAHGAPADGAAGDGYGFSGKVDAVQLRRLKQAILAGAGDIGGITMPASRAMTRETERKRLREVWNSNLGPVARAAEVFSVARA